MLPRLRFVIAAIVIAMLPMVVFSAAPFHIPHDTADAARPANGLSLGPADVRAAQQQLQVAAYARRADELSRLRELASRPLATWVASPAGSDPGQPADPSGSLPMASRPDAATVAPGRVAALSPPSAEPEPAAGDQPVAEPHRPGSEPSLLPEFDEVVSAAPTGPEAPQFVPPLPPEFVPPLPQPRPKAKPIKPARVAAQAKAEPTPFDALFGQTGPAAASR